MGAIDQIVRVTITQDTQAVAQESFSVVLILGATKPSGFAAGELVRTYTSADDMLADGFTQSSPEYTRAQAMYAQNVQPTQFKVGVRSGLSAAQVDEVTVSTLAAGQQLTLVANGASASYTPSDTDDVPSSLNALSAVLPAGITGAVSGSGSTAKLTLTAANSGQVIEYSTAGALVLTSKTAAKGIAADLYAINTVDSGFYGIILPGATKADILQAAPWVESNKKLLLALSSDADIPTPQSTDVISQGQAAGFDRTGILYKVTNPQEGADAAWLGSLLPTVPGSTNWALKTLAGITVDTLTPNVVNRVSGTPIAGLLGKGGNTYTRVAGVNITMPGAALSGKYFDLTHGIDWLESRIQTNIYAAYVSAGKIPYTDAGVTVLMSATKAALDEGAANGLIDAASPITIDAAKVADVPKNQRAKRIAPTVKFSCRLQGAQNAVDIQGTASV